MEFYRYKRLFILLDTNSIGLSLERSEDSTNSSEKTNWGTMFSQFMKNYTSMRISDVLQLSYPQFKALYREICNIRTFPVVIPYMGGGEDSSKDENIKNETNEITDKEGILQMIAGMNAQMKI